jgi:hypothetical protein
MIDQGTKNGIQYSLNTSLARQWFLLGFKLPPRCESWILSFGWFPVLWIFYTDVSEHCLFHLYRSCDQDEGSSCSHDLWRWKRQSVPKHRYIKFRPMGITQKKEYNTDFLLCSFKTVATTDRNTTLNGRRGLYPSCSGWNSVTGNEFYFMCSLFKFALHNSNYITWRKKDAWSIKKIVNDTRGEGVVT